MRVIALIDDTPMTFNLRKRNLSCSEAAELHKTDCEWKRDSVVQCHNQTSQMNFLIFTKTNFSWKAGLRAADRLHRAEQIPLSSASLAAGEDVGTLGRAALPKSLLADWIAAVADWFNPIYGLMHRNLLEGGGYVLGPTRHRSALTIQIRKKAKPRKAFFALSANQEAMSSSTGSSVVPMNELPSCSRALKADPIRRLRSLREFG